MAKKKEDADEEEEEEEGEGKDIEYKVEQILEKRVNKDKSVEYYVCFYF